MVRETICYKSIKYFSKQEKEKNMFLKSPMHSELQSHTVRNRRTSHEREVHQEHISQRFQNLEHKEAQQRVQFQAGEVMMTSMTESFQETLESERQAVSSPQELAIALRNEMSHEIKACVSWKKEVIRVAKEVAEQSTTSTALSDTRSVADESSSKRKEAEKFQFEPWPQASRFGSRKVSFRREVMSGSTHP